MYALMHTKMLYQIVCIPNSIQKKRERARYYGIRQVPTVAVDGQVVIWGKPTEAQLKHYLDYE